MKRNKILLMFFIFLLVFSGCKAKDTELYNPQLTITGDVKNPLILDNLNNFTREKTKIDDVSIETISMVELLSEVVPLGEEQSLFLTGLDGVMTEILLSEIDETSRLGFSPKNGWQFYSPTHPVQSGIKDMEYIVINSSEISDDQKCVRIIDGDKDIALSYGDLFTADSVFLSVLEGSPKFMDKSAFAYSRRVLIPISNYTRKKSKAIGYFADGRQKEISLDGYLNWRGNSADYIDVDGKTILKDIVGIWIDYPEFSVTDIADHVNNTQDNVMIIEVDGLGLEVLNSFRPDFLWTKEVSSMRTVFPSISNVALASIVTGKTPYDTEVRVRGDRKIKCEDIFEGKDSVVIEGDGQLVEMSVNQTLNPDLNKDGYTDDEVFDSGMSALLNKNELYYIHFHGLDDDSHTYGPFSEEAKKKLMEIDDYIKTLSENFSGTIMIVSDHGQHESFGKEKLGNHGLFSYIDMTVPFIKFEV